MRQTVTILKQVLILVIGLLLLGYFVYHTVYGRKGILVEQDLQTQLDQTNSNVEHVQNDRKTLERRTQGLKPESLDRDLLDEEARRQLGVSKPEEKVILTPQEQQGYK